MDIKMGLEMSKETKPPLRPKPAGGNKYSIPETIEDVLDLLIAHHNIPPHKRVTVDGVSEAQAAVIEAMLPIIQAREQELLAELKEQLPLQYDNYTGTNMEDYQNGHNAAIDQVVEIIEKYREGL